MTIAHQAVAIIPARSGSKRIPKKNIKCFAGTPMITRTISILSSTGLFEEIVVTTDCQKTINLSLGAGASKSIVRPHHLADDHTPTKPVIQHAIKELKLSSSTAVCCVYPCNPFLNQLTLEKCYAQMSHAEDYFCFPVVEYAHPIQRALRLDKQSIITKREPEFEQSRTQDLEPHYHDAGSFYWGTTCMWMSDTDVHSRSLGIPVSRTEAIDIDTIEDWSFAERLYKATQLPASCRD